MWDFFLNYWLQWIFGIIATGIGLWARHYIKLERDSVNRTKAERMKEMRKEIVNELEEKMNKLEEKSDINDKKMTQEINNLKCAVENINTGLLSIQGKNFRESCLILLEPEHEITILEYEQFEEDYQAYKALKGNHKGDTLHDKVVIKFNEQIKKGTGN